MAQTRACAKALRNVLAWVVVLAGYSPTPAEEMTGDEGQPVIQKPQRKSSSGSVMPHSDNAVMPDPEVINAVFEEEHNASPTDVFKSAPPKPSGMTVCPKCHGKNIQRAGISKHGKPYAAFCRDCADKK